MQSSTAVMEKQDKGLLGEEELRLLNSYWRAANYLCVGMIYLLDNPLLREPLRPEHIKHRLLGHWGSDPGQTFIWVHLNRLIKKYDLDAIYISGPGHGAGRTRQRLFGGHLHLAIDAIDRVPRLQTIGAHVKEWLKDQIIDNVNYAHENGTDRPEIVNWRWPGF